MAAQAQLAEAIGASLRRLGYRVVRVSAEVVLRDAEAALVVIRAALP